MSAEVESMFSARQVPWHGLGTITAEAQSGPDALKVAGLDWQVGLETIYTKPDGEYVEVEEARAVIRDTDRSILGVVGPGYQPIQNDQMFEFADALLDTGEVKFETAGSLRGGQFVWALAKIERPVIVAEDETVPYLLLSNSHNGTQAFKALTTPVRVVCMNTLQMAYRNHRSSWKVRHSGDLAGKLDDARLTLNLAYDYYDAFEAEVQHLIDKEVTDTRFKQIVSRLIPKGTTDRSETMRATQRDEIATVYRGDLVQPFTGTAWGVVNALSSWELWGRPHRSKRSRFEVQADKILNTNAELVPMTMKARQWLTADN